MVSFGLVISCANKYHNPFMNNVFMLISSSWAGFQIQWTSTSSSRQSIIFARQNERYFYFVFFYISCDSFKSQDRNKQATEIVIYLFFFFFIFWHCWLAWISVENSLRFFQCWWHLGSMTLKLFRYFTESLPWEVPCEGDRLKIF